MQHLPEPRIGRNAKRSNDPIWVAEFPLNRRDFVRLELIEYNGRLIVNLRKWFTPDEGEPARPTKKGITCSARHLPELAQLLNALMQAQTARLLPVEGDANV